MSGGPNQGGRGRNPEATLLRRIADLEATVRQIPGRFSPRTPAATNSFVDIEQAGHGLTAGMVVTNTGGGWVGADADDAEDIGLVTKVYTADRARICIQGYVRFPDSFAYTPRATYYLGASAGTPATTPVDHKRRAVFWAITANTVHVLGPIFEEWHATRVASLNDVDLVTSPPVDGDVLVYNAADDLWEPGATALPDSGVTPGTYTNATVTVTVKGIVTAASSGSPPALAFDDLTDVDAPTPADLDFVRFDVISGDWINYSLGNLEYDDGEDRLILTDTSLIFKDTARLLLDSGNAIEWLYKGDEALATDQWGRITTADGGHGDGTDSIVFQDDGTTVLEWITNQTTTKRAIKFRVPILVEDDIASPTEWLMLRGTADKKWRLSAVDAVDMFTPAYFLEFDNSGGSPVVNALSNIQMAAKSIYFNNGTSVSINFALAKLRINGDTSFDSGSVEVVSQLTVGGVLNIDGGTDVAGSAGLSVTVPLAKLTPGGVNGSMTFTSGILTARTAPT